MRPAVTGVDNEACLTWLDGALSHALEKSKPELWAYLGAVSAGVLFETEPEPSGRPRT